MRGLQFSGSLKAIKQKEGYTEVTKMGWTDRLYEADLRREARIEAEKKELVDNVLGTVKKLI